VTKIKNVKNVFYIYVIDRAPHTMSINEDDDDDVDDEHDETVGATVHRVSEQVVILFAKNEFKLK